MKSHSLFSQHAITPQNQSLQYPLKHFKASIISEDIFRKSQVQGVMIRDILKRKRKRKATNKKICMHELSKNKKKRKYLGQYPHKNIANSTAQNKTKTKTKTNTLINKA